MSETHMEILEFPITLKIAAPALYSARNGIDDWTIM